MAHLQSAYGQHTIHPTYTSDIPCQHLLELSNATQQCQETTPDPIVSSFPEPTTTYQLHHNPQGLVWRSTRLLQQGDLHLNYSTTPIHSAHHQAPESVSLI
jgi:hypothetical protein